MLNNREGSSESTFTVIVRPVPEEGGYWAEVLELPGCVSQGETKKELFRNITEAIEACLEEGSVPEEFRDGDIWRLPVPA